MRTADLEKAKHDLEKRTDDLEKRNVNLEQSKYNLEKSNDDLELRMTHMASENQRFKITVADLTEQVAMLSRAVSDVMHEVSASPGKPDTYTQFTSFACTSDIVTLSCPSNRTIFVTSAYYGQYNIPCGDCCPPNPGLDCTVDMEENRPSNWFTIKALCDNQTSCQVDNFGSAIDECQEGYNSDYAQVFYDCLPVDEAGPVGFTAWANTGTETEYEANAIIVFDQVISNFGGHYNPDTSSFVCPFDGVYMVNISVMSYVGNQAVGDIMHNGRELVSTWADNHSDTSTQASNTVLVECQRGDVLWIRSGSSDTTLYGTGRRSTFSAFLMHRL